MPTFVNICVMEETPRQKKVATAIQHELAAMLQESIRKHGASNLVLSITKVNVTIDLSCQGLSECFSYRKSQYLVKRYSRKQVPNPA